MTQRVDIHYAVQICDTASYQGSKRFCGDDRTLLSKKSLTSLFLSIEKSLTLNNQGRHNVLLLCDRITDECNQFLDNTIDRFGSEHVHIQRQNLWPKSGIVQSIRQCYQWLDDYGKDLVFQIQDDYLFEPQALGNCIDQFFVAMNEHDTQPIIQPFNDITYWAFGYKNRSTPRLISLGKQGYWIQIYDTSCSFMTSHWQFRQHWDLYDKFFNLIPDFGKPQAKLENASLNYMFTQRGVLGLAPINTLSHHMQTQPDLYVPWQPLWDSIDVNI